MVQWPVGRDKSEKKDGHTLKYIGSTLCLRAWALPTRASTEDTLSGSCRFSTTVLRAPMTRQACFRSWGLLSISKGSSMCLNWLKYCLADGKFTKNLVGGRGWVLKQGVASKSLWSGQDGGGGIVVMFPHQ